MLLKNLFQCHPNKFKKKEKISSYSLPCEWGIKYLCGLGRCDSWIHSHLHSQSKLPIWTTFRGEYKKKKIWEIKHHSICLLKYLFLFHLYIYFIIIMANIYLLCSRNCSKCFMRIFSVYPHSSHCKVYFPHFIDEETGSERLRYCPIIIQLVRDKAEI